jgi:uncharacterized protein (TIRG00374 family)
MGAAPQHEPPEEMPRVILTRKRMVAFGLFVITVVALFYVVLPQLPGLKHTWKLLHAGDEWWLALAVVFEIVSMAGYIMIFQGVHVPPGSPINYRQTYEITMASLAATRIFAAGGAGGVVLTAWALRRSGMPRREVAERMIAFLFLIYGVYMAAMIVCGIGLYTHLFPGSAPFALTIVPAIFGGAVIAVVLAIGFVPHDLARRLGARAQGDSHGARALRRLAAIPESMSGGVRFALYKLRHPDLALSGAVVWWGFNVAVLWATFRAFGEPPPLAVLIQGYFVGTLGNLLPLPGGVGGVDVAMIGVFVAFGVNEPLAYVAVLTYRLFAFWLPTVPGAFAYFQLRRTVHGWEQGAEEPAAGALNTARACS